MAPPLVQGRFGRFIQERRRHLGMTLADMAYKLGVTPEYISIIERDARRKFDLNKLPAVAHALDCSILELTSLDLVERAPDLAAHMPLPKLLCLSPDDQEIILRMLNALAAQPVKTAAIA